MSYTCDTGDEVTIAYTAEAAIRRERKTMDVTVIKTMGETLYAETSLDDVNLVLDSEGDLWARDTTSRVDRLFGSNAEVA